jgi:hypothetical protein
VLSIDSALSRKSLKLFRHAAPVLEHALNTQGVLRMLADKRSQGPLRFRWHGDQLAD